LRNGTDIIVEGPSTRATQSMQVICTSLLQYSTFPNEDHFKLKPTTSSLSKAIHWTKGTNLLFMNLVSASISGSAYGMVGMVSTRLNLNKSLSRHSNTATVLFLPTVHCVPAALNSRTQVPSGFVLSLESSNHAISTEELSSMLIEILIV
jgi:hypothetical protein